MTLNRDELFRMKVLQTTFVSYLVPGTDRIATWSGIRGSPEGREAGSPGDGRIDVNNGNLWLKTEGLGTTTGWTLAGSLATLNSLVVDSSRSLISSDLGRLLLADPNGGSIEITLTAEIPFDQFVEVIQVSAGTVSFIAGAGTTLGSTAGANPSLSGTFSGATLSHVDFSGTNLWIANGSFA